MNQNSNSSNQNVQPIEVVDLAKTHVLNLTEVEEAANYEVKTSKRPVIMLAIAGVFSIIMGFLYPIMMNAIDGTSGNVEEAPKPVVFKFTLTCNLASPNSPDGTDSNTSIVFNFENSKLVNYTKTIDMVPTLGNNVGVVSVQNYLTSFKTLENNNIKGYTIKSDSVNNGFHSVLTVDFADFNKNDLTLSYTANSFTNVNYEKDQNVDKVKEQVELAGYVCDK